MAKLSLRIPLINGCGTGSYLDVFQRLDKMGADFGAYLIKSIGPFSESEPIQSKYAWLREKEGNPNPVTVYTGSVLLNSMALPTHPVESWIRELKEADISKPIIGSVWGITPEDYSVLIRMVNNYVSAWEVNVSCPNKEKGEESVMEAMRAKVKSIFEPLKSVTAKPIIAKLSPNEDYVGMAKEVAPFVDYICCGNTIGPGLVIDIHSRRPVLAGKYGGMSGAAMKPKIMKMVNDVYEAVKDSVEGVVASGGIETWEDVIEYAIAGACLFEIGTGAFTKITPDNRMVGRTSEEIVEFTKGIWRGVQGFLEKEDITLEVLVGSMRG